MGERLTQSASLLRARGLSTEPCGRETEESAVADRAALLLGGKNYAATPQQVSRARHWVCGLLAPCVDDDILFDVVLCAGELVDNARKHGCSDGPIGVAVYLGADAIRLEVKDDGTATTVPHVTENVATENGRGLKIVATLASRWGWRKDQDLHQIVWCEFSVPNSKERVSGNDDPA